MSAWVDMHRGDFGCRLTIIGPDGRVIADTETDPETMDDHSARPEVWQALTQGSGVSTRHSATLEVDMLYVAHPWGDDGSVIRAAIPLAQTFRKRDQLFLNLGGVLLAALLASAFLGSRFANTLSRPILDMAQLSQEMARGDFSKRILARGTREVRNLAKAFNQMADALDRTITDLGNKKNQLAAILQSMDSGVVAVDDRYNVILLNPAARTFFNIQEEAIGQYFLRLSPGYAPGGCDHPHPYQERIPAGPGDGDHRHSPPGAAGHGLPHRPGRGRCWERCC